MSELTGHGAIYIGADACPVKREVYRVAERHSLRVFTLFRTASLPSDAIHSVVVGSEPDATDNWIAQRVDRRDIVVTSDIPLASVPHPVFRTQGSVMRPGAS